MTEEQIKADIDMWLDSLEGNLVHGFGISKEGARDEIMSLIAEEQKSLLEMVKLEKRKMVRVNKPEDNHLNSISIGYNNAVNDLDQLKAQLTTEGGGK